MRSVLVTAATPGELTLLTASLEGRERVQLCRRDAHRGEIGGWPVIAMATGIGKVNTAAAVAGLLERFEPELLINTGCAGAYEGSGLHIGDMAMATIENMGDEGVLAPTGWHPMDFIGIPVIERNGDSYFNSFPLSSWPLAKARYVADATGITLHQGPFVTVSTATGTSDRGRELSARFGAICENMEGGAAAQVAIQYGVDCLELRGVSNYVEDRDLSRWDIPRAVETAQMFVIRFIQSLVYS